MIAMLGHALAVFIAMVASLGAMYRMSARVTAAYERQLDTARRHAEWVETLERSARRIDALADDAEVRARATHAALSRIELTRRALVLPDLWPLALEVFRLEWTPTRPVAPAPRFPTGERPARAIELD